MNLCFDSEFLNLKVKFTASTAFLSSTVIAVFVFVFILSSFFYVYVNYTGNILRDKEPSKVSPTKCRNGGVKGSKNTMQELISGCRIQMFLKFDESVSYSVNSAQKVCGISNSEVFYLEQIRYLIFKEFFYACFNIF